MKKLILLMLFIASFMAPTCFAQEYYSRSLGYWQIDTLYAEVDTAGAAEDSIAQFLHTSRFSQIDVLVQDTTGGAVDTFVVERFSPMDSSWVIVGATDLLSGSVVTSLIPGNGSAKWYAILVTGEYGNYIRIRRTNTVKATGSKSIVQFRGK